MEITFQRNIPIIIKLPAKACPAMPGYCRAVLAAAAAAAVVGVADAAKRVVISTDKAPAAIGPYSQAIMVEFASGEKMIHAAGQIGM